MHKPFAGSPRLPDDVVALSWTDIDGVRVIPSGCGKNLTIERNDGQRTAMDVHGMNKIVAAADESESDCLSNLHPDRVGRRICFAIDREDRCYFDGSI